MIVNAFFPGVKRGFRQSVSFFFVFAFIVFSGLIGCDNSDIPDKESLDLGDPAVTARLEEAFLRWMNDYGIHGASVSVFTPEGSRWSGSAGVVTLEGEAPFATDTKARIGSATKPFTATVILQLIDEGLLSLDTRLSEFLPDYPNGSAITVENLLSHRSGIPELQLDDLVFIQYLLKNVETWLTPEEIMEWTYKDEPIFSLSKNELVPREPVTTPGGDYYYSQPNYIALGIIIERVTGRNLAEVFDERIFSPLNMTGTFLPGKDAGPEPIVYTNLFGMQEEKVPITKIASSMNSYNSSGWAAGGLVSTVDDLARFLPALLEGGLLSPRASANMTNWKVSYPEGFGLNKTAYYGLGLSKYIRDTFSMIGHNGGVPGAGSVMQYIPELDVYVIAVRNADMDQAPEGTPDLIERIKRAILNEAQ